MSEPETQTGMTSQQADKVEAQYKALGWSVEKTQSVDETWTVVATPPSE